MRIKTGLQISAIFAPLLALVVGLALFLKSRNADEVSDRLRLMDITAEEVFELDIVCQQYLARHEPSVQKEWQTKRSALADLLASESVRNPGEKMVLDSMLRNMERMKEIFGQLVALYGSDAVASAQSMTDRVQLESELLRVSKTLVSGTLKLTSISHRRAIDAQQSTDALIIVFSAILAVLMAGLAYAAVKDEIARRKQMSHELEQSHILLSDAFVKLRRAEQGIHQERLQALEQMAQGIGAEIRSHLIPILRISDTLLNYPESLQDSDKAFISLTTMHNAAKSANTALERLTQFVTGESREILPQSVNLSLLAESALLFVQPKINAAADAHAPVKIRKELKDVPLIDGAEMELREALVNLILNAVEAMPSGGTITLATRTEGEQVILAVTDTGKGMTEEVLRQCCEPFFSTKGEAADGMGLTTVSRAVHRHGGTLDIKSQINAGTAIALHLPVHSPNSAAGAQPVQPPQVVRNLSILVVDDHQWVRQTLQEILAIDDHKVEVAVNGSTGLNKFRAGRFDLVITDRAMPDMGGEQLASLIKRASPRMPVVLLTGFGEIIRGAGVSSSTVDVVLSKPVTPDKLRQAIAEAIKKYAA